MHRVLNVDKLLSIQSSINSDTSKPTVCFNDSQGTHTSSLYESSRGRAEAREYQRPGLRVVGKHENHLFIQSIADSDMSEPLCSTSSREHIDTFPALGTEAHLRLREISVDWAGVRG